MTNIILIWLLIPVIFFMLSLTIKNRKLFALFDNIYLFLAFIPAYFNFVIIGELSDPSSDPGPAGLIMMVGLIIILIYMVFYVLLSNLINILYVKFSPKNKKFKKVRHFLTVLIFLGFSLGLNVPYSFIATLVIYIAVSNWIYLKDV